MMFTLCLIFTVLYAFARTEPLPDLGPHDSGPYSMMEFVDAYSPSPPVPFSEEELIKVMSQNGSSPPSFGTDDLQLLRRQYVENDEDIKCAEHDENVMGSDVLHTSWGTVCGGPVRRITCRVYEPEFMVNPQDTVTSLLYCPDGFVCRQDGVRTTRFGDMKPTTSCVLSGQIVSWVIKTRELGEKCSVKFGLPSAGGGKTVKFHTWAWNDSTGLFTELKWMYVKVNGAYVRSVTRVSDWTISYDGIKSSDALELCGTAWPDTPELELQGQSTVL